MRSGIYLASHPLLAVLSHFRVLVTNLSFSKMVRYYILKWTCPTIAIRMLAPQKRSGTMKLLQSTLNLAERNDFESVDILFELETQLCKILDLRSLLPDHFLRIAAMARNDGNLQAASRSLHELRSVLLDTDSSQKLYLLKVTLSKFIIVVIVTTHPDNECIYTGHAGGG